MTAAGFLINQEVGEYATIIKMIRILMLGPIMVMLVMIYNTNSDQKGIKNIFTIHSFIIGFIIISLLTNIGIEITDIQIIKYKYNKKNLKYLKFKICNNDYNINVEIGLKYKYENFPLFA